MTTTPNLIAPAAELDLDKIEALARAATPGHWYTHPITDDDMYPRGLAIAAENGKTLSDEDTGPGNADAEFIAAANPAVVLDLIGLARSAAPAPAALPEDRLDYIARQYFADSNYQMYVKHAISDAFKEARAAQPAQLEGAQAAWTKQTVEKLSRELAEAVAKNASTVPQLTFPHIYLGLCDALLKPQPAAQAPQAEQQDQVLVDLMPKRARFIAWAKNRRLDVTEEKDDWGNRKFGNYLVQLLWEGWFNAPATYAQPAAQAGEQLPVNCSGNPASCPDNEGYGCHCGYGAPAGEQSAEKVLYLDQFAIDELAQGEFKEVSGSIYTEHGEGRTQVCVAASRRAPASSRTTGGDEKPVAWMHEIDSEPDGRRYFNVYYERTPGYCVPLYAAPASDTASDDEPPISRSTYGSLEECEREHARRAAAKSGASAPDSSAQVSAAAVSPVGVAMDGLPPLPEPMNFVRGYGPAAVREIQREAYELGKARILTPSVDLHSFALELARKAGFDIAGGFVMPPRPSGHFTEEIVELVRLATPEGAALPQGKPERSETAAARDVLAERRRQVEQEGWTPAHDDEHGDGQMAVAAGYYALACGYPHERDIGGGHLPTYWPWDRKWWKPRTKRENLVRAGGLVLAEIERLDRARDKQGAQDGGAAEKGGA